MIIRNENYPESFYVTISSEFSELAETCENCGAPMGDWSATHCSEECLLHDIRNSRSYFDDSGIDELITKMRKENRFDMRLLDDFK